MKNIYILIIFLAVFILSYYLGQVLRNPQENLAELKLKKMDYGLCDPSSTACNAKYLSHQIKFKFQKNPSALEPFTVYAEISDNHIKEVLVDFRMKNMDMGVSIIRLKNMGNNRWAGEAVLPVCSLGRSDWISRLQIKSNNTQWYADFLFQQK